MRKLENKTLDEIGIALVKADVLSSRDIERVTGNPALFDLVRARVKAAPKDAPPKRALVGLAAVGGFASIALVATVFSALIVFRSKPIELVRDPTPAASKNYEPPKFTEPDKIANTDFRRTAPAPRAERISTKTEIKFNRPKSAAQQIRYEGDFYALSYAGDPNETERGGRIVRVDVSRSTLFAMGVDVPLENETDTVKADLLVGSDGVTRAIRLVK